MDKSEKPDNASFPAIKGEMAERVRCFDWSATPLGPIASWPQSLKTAAGMVLLSPVPIVMLWGEGGIMIYNDAYSVFAGGRHPELLGSKVREGWPEVAEFNDNVMKVGLAGGTLAYRDQELTLHRSGKPEPVWMNLDYSPILDESGLPAGVMAIVVETTARVLAERAYGGELKRWRQLFEQAPGFICTLRGKEQVFDFVNAAHRKLFNSADWVGRPLRAAFPDLEGQGYYEAIDRVFETGERLVFKSAPVRYRYTPDAPEGERLLDFVYEAIRDETSKINGIFCEGFDVTEQRNAEDALRRSEEQLRLATEHAEIGLWDVDTVRDALFWTPQVKAMFGVSPHVPVTLDDFFNGLHPGDRAATSAAFDAANDPEQRALYDVEYRTIGKEDGVIRWVHAKGRGVFDENGKCLRVIGTAIDITAHKLERARQALLVELGERLRMLDDPDDLAFAAAELLGRAFNVSRAGYGTIDPVQETITIERDWNAPSIKSLAGTLHFRDYGSYIEALKRGVTVTIPDAREDPRTAANAGALEAISARALINMPVTEQGGFVALLYLNHESVRAWTEEDIALIREVAERTRVAVERRRVEAALQRSEEQLRLATDYAEVGLWDIDTVKDIVYWPPRVHAMFGTEPGTPVTMKQFRGAIHPDDKRRVIGAILQACDPEKRTLYDCEYRVVRGDGTQRWLAAKGRAIFDETGRCIRMLGIILDITGRREIEEQARASEARFRALFESIDDGFCIIEAIAGPDGSIADFRYIEENPALAKRSGIMGVLGHTIREMLPVEADAWIATLAGVLESGEPLRFERFLETSGRLLELFVLRVGARSSNQVAVLFQDITERRAAEQQLHEMNETLERRVAERTAALERSQAALQQAQKMEAIGNLTGGIAHDFNNLLQGVTGSLDLIRRKPDNIERVRHWAESGLQAAERGAKLTAQLLAFSRSQKLELKPVDLSALLTGMRDLMERTLGPSVRVRLDLDSRASNVMGDETQLELAVLNLAINARDAMAEGGELVIATRGLTARNDPELAPGEYIALSVADTGAGMAPDIAARAFDPFFTTKGVGKGTGLGLSQVYGMARQAGGIARIRSTAGQGTTISIFLPITDAAARPDIAHSDNGHARSAVSATILVVDDDADVRRFLADALDALGYAVMLAEDGPSCLDTLSRSLPDLMIVDYAMPEMTGAEVAHKARARHPGLPILFASGYAETSALEDALDGGTQVLRKPFRMNELQDAIIRALRH